MKNLVFALVLVFSGVAASASAEFSFSFRSSPSYFGFGQSYHCYDSSFRSYYFNPYSYHWSPTTRYWAPTYYYHGHSRHFCDRSCRFFQPVISLDYDHGHNLHVCDNRCPYSFRNSYHYSHGHSRHVCDHRCSYHHRPSSFFSHGHSRHVCDSSCSFFNRFDRGSAGRTTSGHGRNDKKDHSFSSIDERERKEPQDRHNARSLISTGDRSPRTSDGYQRQPLRISPRVTLSGSGIGTDTSQQRRQTTSSQDRAASYRRFRMTTDLSRRADERTGTADNSNTGFTNRRTITTNRFEQVRPRTQTQRRTMTGTDSGRFTSRRSTTGFGSRRSVREF